MMDTPNRPGEPMPRPNQNLQKTGRLLLIAALAILSPVAAATYAAATYSKRTALFAIIGAVVLLGFSEWNAVNLPLPGPDENIVTGLYPFITAHCWTIDLVISVATGLGFAYAIQRSSTIRHRSLAIVAALLLSALASYPFVAYASLTERASIAATVANAKLAAIISNPTTEHNPATLRSALITWSHTIGKPTTLAMSSQALFDENLRAEQDCARTDTGSAAASCQRVQELSKTTPLPAISRWRALGLVLNPLSLLEKTNPADQFQLAKD